MTTNEIKLHAGRDEITMIGSVEGEKLNIFLAKRREIGKNYKLR